MMKICTELNDFLPTSKFGLEASDDAVLDGFSKFLVSYNAEAAWCGYLGVACEIALQRPHLFVSLLPTVVDPAYCMGVASAESFIAYAKELIEQDAASDPKYQNFSRDGAHHSHQLMSCHAAEIQRLLDQWAEKELGR
jgi:hypothetical protein